ncbi:tumor suppressor candidate 3-like protein [Dermatophagoides farinae]|uniref:Tumor suppressor candidate 3-like protein n=2 Tax=Dermatophagoides farinae TaxID=6954 RepID=A0A9D4P6W4_DERFA|nr:tumor suppressor candidate 3-like protein [Dermatophagoides farinae]
MSCHMILLCLAMIWLIPIINANAKKKESPHMPLEERSEKLIQMSFKRPMIRLNPEKFRTFIGSKQHGQPIRNYTFVVMMTALSPGRQCSVCRSAADEFSIVANSWRYSSLFNPSLFFGFVDYDEGSEIFQQLKINSAPVFLLFSERQMKANTLLIKHADQMDIQRIGFSAETIARWIAEKTSISIRVVRPPNYTASFLLVIFFSLFSIILYVRRNNLDFLGNKTSWSVTALAIVFGMTSGQMWSHIRGPPLMHRSANGISYIHNGSGGQFIIETYIIFVINCAIAAGFIFIIHAVKQSGKIDQKKKKIMLIAGVSLIAIFFSFLMSIFRGKAHGYPYSFLFK